MDDNLTDADMVEYYLTRVIGNLGYPVGMGMFPHEDITRKWAEEIVKIVRSVPPAGSRP